MKTIDLTQYGIIGSTVKAYNPSYEELFEAEMNPALTGYEKGQQTNTSWTMHRATNAFGGPLPSTRTTTTP